ncbi:hypothetical protein ER308_06000 [Egibacter rhizosphaerae]|uniref:Uncharacterized protein n=1 Tax=Egibacter rhizosphaerae TaxID=1670831 RepID=A0A411YD67_9ACTN|nr:hypothetical protein [Egibacter rhizosphaerae]QBI19135.1 hypothetical protein ER308_06000 [Egibacter rhizosphaerae]
MIALLVGSGVAAAAVAGFALGFAWSLLPVGPIGPPAAAALVLAAVAGDVAARRWRVARPLSVNRQVPTAWSQVFSREAVAVLYGARLGIGPLTILSSWLWWAAILIGVATGPWVAAGAAGAFALARAVTVVVTAEAIRADAPPRMARVRRAGPVAGLVLVATSALVAGWPLVT